MNQPENNPKKRKDLKDLIDAIEDKTYSSNNNPKNQDSVNRGQDDPDLDFEASIQETQNNLDLSLIHI